MAEITTTNLVKETTVTGYICDKCGVEFKDYTDLNNFLHIDTTFGYGSHLWGDGFRLKLDICEKCSMKLFGLSLGVGYGYPDVLPVSRSGEGEGPL